MKLVAFLKYASLAAIVFNLRVFQGNVWDRLWKLNFLPLCVVTMGLFWAYAVWVSRQYTQIAHEYEEENEADMTVTVCAKHVLPRYLLRAAGPILLFHTAMVWCIAAVAEHTVRLFTSYMASYFLLLALMVVGYSILLFFHPQYVLAGPRAQRKEEKATKEPPVVKEDNLKEERPPVADRPLPNIDLDRPIDLYSVFFYLLKSGGMGPVMKGMHTRFVDIAAIHTHDKAHYVLLTNGEKMFAGHIMDELKKRDLDRWMVKISRNYYINMLLVYYPIDARTKQLQPQREVYVNMLKKLTPDEIQTMFKIGSGVERKPVKDFLENQNSMDHKGWDDFIPLH